MSATRGGSLTPRAPNAHGSIALYWSRSGVAVHGASGMNKALEGLGKTARWSVELSQPLCVLRAAAPKQRTVPYALVLVAYVPWLGSESASVAIRQSRRPAPTRSSRGADVAASERSSGRLMEASRT